MTLRNEVTKGLNISAAGAASSCKPDLWTMWFVYILECSDGSYYAGITTDLQRRIGIHNAGVASRWTRGRRPVRYRYAEACKSQSEARKREMEIKGWRREKKAALFTLPANLCLT
jgi:putative endonuclease